jgi:hypothetical protein
MEYRTRKNPLPRSMLNGRYDRLCLGKKVSKSWAGNSGWMI